MAKKELPLAAGAVEVVLLDGGGCTTGDDRLLHADGHAQPCFLHVWCFFIHHKPTGRKILWDLGFSDDRSLYTPFVLNAIFPAANPVGPRCSLGDQLEALGVAAEDIDTVIFSHAHCDHCRPAKKEFPNAKILFGAGTKEHCRPGHIQDGKIVPTVQWDARFFSDDPNIRSEHWEEIDGPWQAWGPFAAAMDYFGDGSFWIINAPGHMPGNLAACARLTSGEHVLLGSDCCHSRYFHEHTIRLLVSSVTNPGRFPKCRAIFEGTRQIANLKKDDGSTWCIHDDLDTALHTIEVARAAVHEYGMHLALAHDAEWIKDGRDQTLISILHPHLKSKECRDRVRAGMPP